jgi:hypothetical protein
MFGRFGQFSTGQKLAVVGVSLILYAAAFGGEFMARNASSRTPSNAPAPVESRRTP